MNHHSYKFELLNKTISKPFLEPLMTEHEPISTAIKLHLGSSFSLIKSTTALNTNSDLTVGRLNQPKCSAKTSFFAVQK